METTSLEDRFIQDVKKIVLAFDRGVIGKSDVVDKITLLVQLHDIPPPEGV